MDPIAAGALALLIILALWRMGRTMRSTRTGDGEQIRRKLEELRKKRDEDDDAPIV